RPRRPAQPLSGVAWIEPDERRHCDPARRDASAANRELRAPLARLTGAPAGRGEADVRSHCAGDVRLVADVARVDGYLPPVASRLEARAQVDKPVCRLRLDGGVERREEYAALARHVTPKGRRPEPASVDIV